MNIFNCSNSLHFSVTFNFLPLFHFVSTCSVHVCKGADHQFVIDVKILEKTTVLFQNLAMPMFRLVAPVIFRVKEKCEMCDTYSHMSCGQRQEAEAGQLPPPDVFSVAIQHPG